MKDRKQNKYWLILFLLIVCHATFNYSWLKQDSESLGADVCHHTLIAVSLRQELKEIIVSNTSIIEKFKEACCLFGADISLLNWPILVHYIAALVSLAARDVLFYIRFSNMIYFAILVISIYLLGKKIRSAEAGIVSAYFVSLYPAVFGPSRKFGLDFPLTAMVCLIIYFLLSSGGFQNRLYSILFGISLGMGMLIKAQCLFFIIGPFLYVVIKQVRKKQHKSNYISNIIIAVTLAVLIALVWWYRFFLHPGWAISLIRSHFFSRPPTSAFKGGSILEEIIYYLKGINFYISPAFFIMFLTGLFFYLRSSAKKYFVAIFLWFFVSYLIFSLIPIKSHRYIFPAVGAVALLSVVGWLQSLQERQSLLARYTKVIFILLFICFGAYQFFAASLMKEPGIIHAEWCGLPAKNNHQLIMKRFSKIIQEADSVNKNIAIVAEEYFRGDGSVRLKYFLKIMNNKNVIYLSDGGAGHANVDTQFLLNKDKYEFLIAFSRNNYEPDFWGLSTFSSASIKELAAQASKSFKEYEILKEDTLLPEGINIFLLRKRNSQNGSGDLLF